MAAAPLVVAKLRVVGWSYRLKEDPGLQPVAKGAPLTLERDRANEFDKNAVRVVHAGHAIGFLERGVASVAAALLFDGAHAAGLRLEASCEGMDSAQKHHDLLLRVVAAPGERVWPSMVTRKPWRSIIQARFCITNFPHSVKAVPSFTNKGRLTRSNKVTRRPSEVTWISIGLSSKLWSRCSSR